MTKKKLVRVHVIKSLIEDKMTSGDAAEVLNLSILSLVRLETKLFFLLEINIKE